MADAGAPDRGYVLVVDDERDIRDAVGEVVELAGCSPVQAENGAEALVQLRRRKPCLVILDLAMPVMTGEELLEQMRREPDLAPIPVVISTSAPSRAPRGVPVLVKPVDIDELCDWIAKSCRCARPIGAAARGVR